MTGARVLTGGAGLLAIMVLLVAVLASGPSPQEEQPPPGEQTARSANREGRSIPMPVNLVGVEIALGLKDGEPTPWGGSVQISEGRLVSLQVVGGAANAKVNGNHFTARSVYRMMMKTIDRPRLRVSFDAPPTAIVTVNTRQGEFKFSLADLASGTAKRFLDGRVSAERQAGAVRLTGPETEDDFPAMAKGPDGTVWVAYVAYQPGMPIVNERVRAGAFESLVPTGNGDQIRLLRFDGKVWHPAIDVTQTGLDIWRPAVAVDGQGRVVVAWSQQVDNDWEVFYRRYTPAQPGRDARWSESSSSVTS